jgi:hypothetical protein
MGSRYQIAQVPGSWGEVRRRFHKRGIRICAIHKQRIQLKQIYIQIHILYLYLIILCYDIFYVYIIGIFMWFLFLIKYSWCSLFGCFESIAEDSAVVIE